MCGRGGRCVTPDDSLWAVCNIIVIIIGDSMIRLNELTMAECDELGRRVPLIASCFTPRIRVVIICSTGVGQNGAKGV
mgnify:CR=1 FL=1|jgi:hypothetical protein